MGGGEKKGEESGLAGWRVGGERKGGGALFMTELPVYTVLF